MIVWALRNKVKLYYIHKIGIFIESPMKESFKDVGIDRKGIRSSEKWTTNKEKHSKEA